MILSSIDKILKENNSPVLRYLQTGLSKNYVNNRAQEINLIFPDDLIYLYSWRNGTRWEKVELGFLWLSPGVMFFSLEYAIETYTNRVNEDKYWRTNMFPIFSDGGGDFYLIDLETSSPTFGKIFYYCLNETDFEVIISYFDSLQSCLLTIYEWNADKAFYLDYESEPILKYNDYLERKIGKKNNPESDYWKLYN